MGVHLTNTLDWTNNTKPSTKKDRAGCILYSGDGVSPNDGDVCQNLEGGMFIYNFDKKYFHSSSFNKINAILNTVPYIVKRPYYNG